MTKSGIKVCIGMVVLNSRSDVVYEASYDDYLQIPPYCSGDFQMTAIYLECQARLSAMKLFRRKLETDPMDFRPLVRESLMDNKWIVKASVFIYPKEILHE